MGNCSWNKQREKSKQLKVFGLESEFQPRLLGAVGCGTGRFPSLSPAPIGLGHRASYTGAGGAP